MQYSMYKKTIAQTFTYDIGAEYEAEEENCPTILRKKRKKETAKWQQMGILENPETFLKTDSA